MRKVAKRRAKKKLRETDLYPPLRKYLTAQGYTVRGEVKDCDIAASKGDDLIVIELKRSFTTALLIQAAKRQRITDSVYVALPRQKRSRTWTSIQHLLRRLELGLILVSPNSRKPPVEVVFHPLPFQRQKHRGAKRAILEEIANRSGDFNKGGSTRKQIVTAYRENAIHIACCLDRFGPLAPRQLRALGTGDKTLSIVYSNFYGWFERVERGVYALRQQGRDELKQRRKLVRHYSRLLDGQPEPTSPVAG